jgi:imidazolonepropionase
LVVIGRRKRVSALALVNAGELVTCPDSRGKGGVESLGIVNDGALIVQGGRVAWVGSMKEFKQRKGGTPEMVVDAEGGLVTPGFVDPHTHLVFAGSREDELERKIAGESYTDILMSGGGIVRTIKDTRKARLDEIVGQSAVRLGELVRNGVTTVEVKTGYGQDLETELKLIKAIGRLRALGKIGIVSTFLGLHAKPPEQKTSEEFVRATIGGILPAVARLADRPTFSDCFCEDGVFDRDQCDRYLKASKALGFGLKIHADEFTDSGGASLAAESGCVSADHLGFGEREGLRQMAERKVAAVLLPMTSFYSGIKYADARGTIESGCTVALGTDLSPNSWVESPQLVMSVACTSLRMSPAEALLGFTRNAAQAVGQDDVGSLVVGSKADFVVHNLESYRFLPYRVGGRYVKTVFKEGKKLFEARGD